eukprot:2311470-Rhodomonas_salina.1
MTYDTGSLGSASPQNVPAAGQGLLTVSGIDFGVYSSSVMTTLGDTVGEYTDWVADTAVYCNVGHGVSGSILAVITAGQRHHTRTEVVSYDATRPSLVSPSNSPTTGQQAVTVSGTNLGRVSFSTSGADGETSCESTDWVSGSSVLCNAGSGYRGSLAAVVTVGGRLGTVTEASSYGTAVVSSATPRNMHSSGQISVTMIGSMLGTMMYSVGA